MKKISKDSKINSKDNKETSKENKIPKGNQRKFNESEKTQKTFVKLFK